MELNTDETTLMTGTPNDGLNYSQVDVLNCGLDVVTTEKKRTPILTIK
jgi:hypothetical protein